MNYCAHIVQQCLDTLLIIIFIENSTHTQDKEKEGKGHNDW